jgi:hypothetical protein
MKIVELLGGYLCCKLTASEVTVICWVENVFTICLIEHCQFDSAVWRGCEDKVSGDFEMLSYARERSIWAAHQCSGLVFNEKVRKRFGVGGTDSASYGDAFMVIVLLIVIELCDSHDRILGVVGVRLLVGRQNGAVRK